MIRIRCELQICVYAFDIISNVLRYQLCDSVAVRHIHVLNDKNWPRGYVQLG